MSARIRGALADAAARSSASAGTPRRAAVAKVVGAWVVREGVTVWWVVVAAAWLGRGRVGMEGEGEKAADTSHTGACWCSALVLDLVQRWKGSGAGREGQRFMESCAARV